MSVDLLEILNAKGQVSLAVQSHFGRILKHRSLRKKEFFLKPGQINDTMVFIQKGLMRAYYIKDGVEIGSWFRSEGEFIVSISSFYREKPSEEYMQALEPTEILYITRPELFAVYHENPDFCLNALLLTIDVLVEWDQRCRALNSTSAKERFNWLVINRPDLLDRVPAKYIAGFLGITPETFSKIRSTQFKEWPKGKVS
jgi:CRP/FNR family transcriptional regulator, anaerobic regulatory protein